MIRLRELFSLLVGIYLCQSQFVLTSKLPGLKASDQSLDSDGRLLDQSLYSDGRLLLSKLIESGDDNLARQLSTVNEKYFLGVRSYSGYLTVDEEHHSNSFFWFFPAEGSEHFNEEDQDYDHGEDSDIHGRIKNETLTNQSKSKSDDDASVPVVLWLQGGPGMSSLFGLFTENGPFFVNDDQISIRKNPYSWHTKYHLLFIDNPVGTGFSFTDANGYCQNITQVAKHLYSGLSQFFHLFPSLATNPFYITGESFAGKFIPAIGYEIYERNKIEEFQINLQGLALGNAMSDPPNTLNYGDYAYQTGLVDRQGWRIMKQYEYLAKVHINDLYGWNWWATQLTAFLDYSHYSNVYNILEPERLDLNIFVKFMNQTHIRKAVHVGDQEFDLSSKVYDSLIPDFMTTAMHWTESLLNQGLRIMYYSGNLDVIIAYPLSEESYEKMKWDGSDLYRTSRRNPFYFNDTLHGYIKKANNFYDVLILNAGHMVPTDQPAATLALLDQFIRNEL